MNDDDDVDDRHYTNGEGSHTRARKPETVEREVLENLVNYYFKNIAPMFPVITESEFVHGIGNEPDCSANPQCNGGDPSSPNRANGGASPVSTHEPSPVLLYAICTIAATARHVPFRVFDALRVMLNTVIRSEDVLSHASLANIQALLIAGMVAEAHGRVPSLAMSAAWLRVSTAIRMVSAHASPMLSVPNDESVVNSNY
jgi:hypothetical protein